MIVERHQGQMPRDPQAVRELPGVGRYMAGAILSFAFDLPEPIVEANSQRVLARLLGWRGDLRASSSQARLWKAAERLVPAARGWQVQPGTHGPWCSGLHAALAELSALPPGQSVRGSPTGNAGCAPGALPAGRLPWPSQRPARVVVRAGRVLMVQRGEGGLWSNFWEFPTIHLEGADPAGRSFGSPVSLGEGVRRLTGIHVEVGPELKTCDLFGDPASR